MTFTKKTAKLVLILLGLVILVVGYAVVYNPYTDKAETVTAQTEALMPELQELRGHYEKLDEYYQGIEDSKKTIAEETARYDTDVRSEDLIMYAVRLENRIGMDIDQIALPGMTPVMAYQLTSEEGVKNTRNVWQTDMTLGSTMNYDQMKAFIDFVNNTQPRTALKQLTLTYNVENGLLKSTSTISKYFIAGDGYVYQPTKIQGVTYGTDNLFGTFVPELEEGEEGEIVLD